MKSCLIILMALSAWNAAADDSLSVLPPESEWIPALQSAAVPGWGQASCGQWLRGSLFFLSEAFLAYEAHHFWESQYQRADGDVAGRIYDRDTAYGLAAWYALGALYCAADAYYCKASQRPQSPTLAVLRSIVFPGWGQLSNGKPWKAAGVFCLQTGLAFAAYTQHQRFIYYDGLGQATQARFYKDDRNRLIWWSIGALIYSSVDAFVDCHLQDWDVSENLSFLPIFFPQQQSWGIGVSISFNISENGLMSYALKK
ncbi:MAG: DUF5683 domain-containing protein [bacterium]